MKLFSRRPMRTMRLLLILWLLASLCACTTLPPTPVQIPQLPPVQPAPECTRNVIGLFPLALSTLPGRFLQLSPGGRAKTLLRLKAKDAEQYQTLRAQALRCAPVEPGGNP